MATYLATLNIGKFTILRDTTASGIPVINGVRPDQLTDLARTRLAGIGNIIDFFGTRFGPYPFSSVGAIVDVTNAGYQMETQTRPEFTSANGLSALAHELAHQWFGDHVAVRRMRDVWLSEGFATFANWLWVENNGGTTAQASFNTNYARAANTTFWNNTVLDPGVVNQYQNATVYTRGGMTLQALRVQDRRRRVLPDAQGLRGDLRRRRRVDAGLHRDRPARLGPGPARLLQGLALHARQAERVLLLLPVRPPATSADRRHRPGDAGADPRHPGHVRRVHAGRREGPLSRPTTANVITTAGDAALSIADPSPASIGPPRQRHVQPAAGGAGPRRERAAFARRRRPPPLTLRTWNPPRLQRRRAAGVQATDRGRRRTAHRRLHEGPTLTLSTTSP